jgi:hypothetical protein
LSGHSVRLSFRVGCGGLPLAKGTGHDPAPWPPAATVAGRVPQGAAVAGVRFPPCY